MPLYNHRAMTKIEFMRLWDIYNGLLTATQQEITNLYFNLDLTISEIAEQKGITRQAVSECLNTCKRQLEEYEDKLHVSAHVTDASLQMSFKLTDAGRWAEDFAQLHPEYTADIEVLNDILNRDYSTEVREKLKDPAVRECLNRDYRED